MQEAPGAPGFAEFCTAVLENVEKNKLATSTLLALAGALCSIAREFSVRLCVSSLSEGFIKREMTASGSTPVPIGVLQLVEPGRVAEAVRVVLGDRKKGFQVTSKAGSASVMPSESIGVCLGALSGGHPRTAEILIGAIEKSRDGEPFLGSFIVAWLEDATVDASRALAGVRLFSSFSSLLDKNDEELVSFVWQADKTNFPAVDGVLFYLCTGCESRPGPRRGQLVVVFLQMKNKENVTVKKNVIDSALTASKLFKAAADDPSWTSRCAFVVLSCQEQTLQRNVDLGATDLPVLVVDEAGLQATFGPGLHALIRSSAIAFGTQVIDLTRAEFSE
eukprot:contig_18706_g4593